MYITLGEVEAQKPAIRTADDIREPFGRSSASTKPTVIA